MKNCLDCLKKNAVIKTQGLEVCILCGCIQETPKERKSNILKRLIGNAERKGHEIRLKKQLFSDDDDMGFA